MESLFKTDIVRQFMQDNDYTKEDFCRLCLISIESLNKFLKEENDIFLSEVDRMAKVMKMNLKDLMNDDCEVNVNFNGNEPIKNLLLPRKHSKKITFITID